jgi:hypothetical protein
VKGCIDLPTNKEYYTLGKGNKSVFPIPTVIQTDFVKKGEYKTPPLTNEVKS